MKLSDVKTSRYLTKSEIGNGILGTIASVQVENVAPKDAEAANKPVIYFEEQEKGFVCNVVNFEAICSISGHDDSDDWAGTKIVLYFDENVIFGGKRCGGIRIRAPKQVVKPVVKQVVKPVVKPVVKQDTEVIFEL